MCCDVTCVVVAVGDVSAYLSETEVTELKNEARIDETVGRLQTTMHSQLAVVQENHTLSKEKQTKISLEISVVHTINGAVGVNQDSAHVQIFLSCKNHIYEVLYFANARFQHNLKLFHPISRRSN